MKKIINRKEDFFLLASILLVVYAIFYVLMYHNLKIDSEQKRYGNQLDFTIYSDNELSDDVDILNYFFGDLKTDINYSIKEWNIYFYLYSLSYCTFHNSLLFYHILQINNYLISKKYEASREN